MNGMMSQNPGLDLGTIAPLKIMTFSRLLQAMGRKCFFGRHLGSAGCGLKTLPIFFLSSQERKKVFRWETPSKMTFGFPN
jgi:hypothetical protein